MRGLETAALGSRPARNAVLVARLVLSAALARTESRGAHFRSDFPATDVGWASRRTQHIPAVATMALASVAAPLPAPALGVAV